MVALVTQLILNLIGIGIGAASFDPTSNANPSGSTFSVAAGIWWALSGIRGGAGRRLHSRPFIRTANGNFRLVAWTYRLGRHDTSGLLSSVHQRWCDRRRSLPHTRHRCRRRRANAGFNSANGRSGGGADAGAEFGPLRVDRPVDPERKRGTDPAALRDAATAAVRAVLTSDTAGQEAARERAIQALAKAQNIPVDQARTQVAEYEQQYRQIVDEAKRQATAAADATAKAVSRGALVRGNRSDSSARWRDGLAAAWARSTLPNFRPH